MGHRFLDLVGEPSEPPNRVYARIERVEPENLVPFEPVTMFLDCVDADWIDKAGSTFQVTAAPLSVISLRVARMELLPSPMEPVEGPAWYELLIGDQRTPLPIRQFSNLFDIGAGRFLEKVSGVPPEIAFTLDSHASMDDLPSASLNEIENALSTPLIDAAAVYDVGQGNCGALLSNGYPALYFDFGGGVLNNTRTFPAALKRFCMTAKPTIILSHLDWDHWSSAQRFPQALSCTWVVPRQETSGLVHKAFLANVAQFGRLLIWDNLASATSGQVTVEKCSGRGRNHSGLALTVRDQNTPDTMLFPGDARYSVVPSASHHHHAVVVAPHHGGNLRNQFIPPRAGHPDDRVVFSYGANNSYRHPSEASEELHRDWPVWLDTSLRPRINHTQDESPGHIGLFWNRRNPTWLQPPCGGRLCDLELRQF